MSTHANLEIIIEGMTQEQMDSLMDSITEQVESMGLVLSGRTYITNDEDDTKAEELEQLRKG